MVRHTPHSGPPPSADDIRRLFADEGLQPHGWSNAPADSYGWHSHAYRKVLYCLEGSIVFHTRAGDFELRAGDRLEVQAGAEHAATVGPEGVRCLEAAAD